MYYFSTLFDYHFITRGLAMYDSVSQHSSQPFIMWMLCLDEASYQVLTRLNLPQVRAMSLAEFEKACPALAQVKSARTPLEYAWTCKPAWQWYVIENNPEIDFIMHLDADLFFFDDLQLMYKAMASCSIAIYPHRFNAQMTNRAKRGFYNAGQIGFRRDANGLAGLRWWYEKCLEWCFAGVEEHRSSEQKYLNYLPALFQNVVSVTHPGLGLAPWNWMNHTIHCTADGRILIDEAPLVFYHYSNLKVVGHWFYDTGLTSWKPMPGSLRQWIYGPYLEAIKKSWQKAKTVDPHVHFANIRLDHRFGPRAFANSLLQNQIGFIK